MTYRWGNFIISKSFPSCFPYFPFA